MNANNNIQSSINSDNLLKKYLPSKKTIAIAATATVIGLLGYQMLNNYLYPDLSTLVPQACYPQSFFGFNTPFENCVPISKLKEYLPLAKTTSSIAKKVINPGSASGNLRCSLSNPASNATTLVNAFNNSSFSLAQSITDKAIARIANETQKIIKIFIKIIKIEDKLILSSKQHIQLDSKIAKKAPEIF